jgi:NAD(P)-dependent dehydrogenase (short-subunit alcohol dehydrogenase family)
MLLANKVSIVTGGGTGIGAATARLFASEGSSVVISGRRADPCEAVVAEIQAAGGNAAFLQGDVSQAGDVKALVGLAVARFGGVDVLVNNAGLDVGKPLLETTEEEWDLVLDVNLKGHFLCAQAVVPAMLQRGGGCIVNTSSVLGLASMVNCGAYCASKAGILGLTRSMALEWTGLGVRVNCVVPGSTDTVMMWGGLSEALITSRRRAEEEVLPIGRLADPEEIAQASLWLCSPGASFVAGASIVVDGAALTEYPAPRWRPGATGPTW